MSGAGDGSEWHGGQGLGFVEVWRRPRKAAVSVPGMEGGAKWRGWGLFAAEGEGV